jgi:hypothetical protein
MIGGIVVIALWACLLAWTATVAQRQGRLALVWAFASGLAGIAGFGLGVAIVYRALDLDAATPALILLMLVPLVLMVGAMTAIVYIVRHGPVHVALAKTWPVQFIDRGEGKVSFEGKQVTFVWRDGSREAPLVDVRGRADGECVRVTIAEDELCLMPMGKPDSPEGRRRQSVLLARMLGG